MVLSGSGKELRFLGLGAPGLRRVLGLGVLGASDAKILQTSPCLKMKRASPRVSASSW